MGAGKALGHAGAAEVKQAALKFEFSRFPSQHLPDGRCFLLALPERRQGTRVELIPVPAAGRDTTPSVPPSIPCCPELTHGILSSPPSSPRASRLKLQMHTVASARWNDPTLHLARVVSSLPRLHPPPQAAFLPLVKNQSGSAHRCQAEQGEETPAAWGPEQQVPGWAVSLHLGGQNGHPCLSFLWLLGI